jgi:hypothetical protein
MARADDIVRARLATQSEDRAQQQERARDEQITALRVHLATAIPRLLELLEKHDYPGGSLVSVPGPRRRFGKQSPSEEKAAWLLDEDRNSDGSRPLWLLSDGRILTYNGPMSGSSGPYGVEEIVAGFSPEGALRILQRAAPEIDRLIARYEA